MNLLYDSRIRSLIELAKEQGFVIEHCRKSFRVIPPDKSKPMFSISCTPSDVNTYWQLRRDLRRAGLICK